jgi:hypothetical protein
MGVPDETVRLLLGSFLSGHKYYKSAKPKFHHQTNRLSDQNISAKNTRAIRVPINDPHNISDSKHCLLFLIGTI